ncbi:MAG: hypothetical protein GAK28_00170 [Luteibacter sp.]|uniref:ERF family protein n=1 Tax=Luteibacter sp. TaxID=1886636 RepID=UPI001384454D|nr:ERF family protein [Luteibacter sp.]KAF1009532.1 MAG: hypothetical protein GAK28_00170 [Luteibacter sp.]
MSTMTATTIHEGTLGLEPREVRAEQTTKALSATPTPADLLGMAMAQGADLDRLERLMALQERWEANQAEKAYVTAMTAFKAKPIDIYKRKRVRFQTSKGVTEYNHAELADVVDAAITGMAEHGLSHAWETEQRQGGWIAVTCVVTHAQGHSKRTMLTAQADDSGGKNSIQAVGSTITYLQRYTLLAALGLATKGMDDDGRGSSASGRPAAADDGQPDEVRDRIVDDLYACADNGMEELMKAWRALPEASRARVGREFAAIKARAEKASA